MKKIATLLLAAGLVFGVSTGASAIDFKAKGQWIVSFDYGMNGNFGAGTAGKKTTGSGYKNNADDFDAMSRVRLQLDAVASENLSGTVHFEMGNSRWGNAGAKDGGALGADGQIVKVKWAYLDWMIPETDAKVRMGIQPMGLPSYTTGSQIFNDDTAGVQVSYQFTDNVAATLFWARPYNDNGKGYKWNSASNQYEYEDSKTNYMDNVDMFGLSVPVTLDGVKVNPFFMIGAIGPNFARNGDHGALAKTTEDGFDSKTLSNAGWGDTLAGMFPLGGARGKDGELKGKKVNQYATAWWAGLTADITVLDPLRIAFDFNYGSVDWGQSSLKRAGWLANALVEYKMDWGVPGVVGWYASGDDGNPANGSERMPVLGANTTNNGFSNFAFTGAPYLAEREAVISSTMVGTWGVGLRVRDMSFIEDLKHTFRVNYIGGTNSPKMIKRYGSNNDVANGYTHFATQFGGNREGAHGLYMTTMDQAVELGLSNTYKIYENLTACLDANYIFASLNRNRLNHENGKKASVKDPWNINLSFMYSF